MALGLNPVSSTPISALDSELAETTSTVSEPVKTFYAKPVSFEFYANETKD